MTVLGRYASSPDKVWTVISDHERIPEWSPARSVKIVSAPNGPGVGVVRRIEFGPGVSVDEEVLCYDPPHRYVYRAIRGLPANYHLGEMRVEPTSDGGTQLFWTVTIGAKAPFVAEMATAMIRRGFNDALKRLGRVLGER